MTMYAFLTYAGLFAVSCVLIAGLWTMLRGHAPNTSQKLMRWRVGLQFITIIIVMAGLYLSTR